MAKEDYTKGDVKFVSGNDIPISEVIKKTSSANRPGTVFRKQYENAAIIGVTSPTNTWDIGITQADEDNFEFFNRLEVHNRGNTDIDIRINGSTTNKEFLPSGGIKIFGKEDNLNFKLIKIYNRDIVTQIEIAEIICIVARVNT